MNYVCPFKVGDRVKHSEHTLRRLRDNWNNQGRQPMKTAAQGYLDKAKEQRGTVIAILKNGVQVKLDDENSIHSSLDYLWEKDNG